MCNSLHNSAQLIAVPCFLVASVGSMCACHHDDLRVLSIAEFIGLHNRTQFLVDLLCVYVRLL